MKPTDTELAKDGFTRDDVAYKSRNKEALKDNDNHWKIRSQRYHKNN